MDAAELRAAFPVLRERAYLNAGTFGPLPEAAAAAAREAADIALANGRYVDYFNVARDAGESLREAYAGIVGATADDIAITTSTTEGVARVLAGLDLREGDEVITSTTEHPGITGPLSALRRRGIIVSAVPLADVADAVTSQTKLVACHHVDWSCGAVAPAALAQLDIPVLLDGAQGAGAIKLDVEELGCAFYAAAGQKWLCGPSGTGLLYVAPQWRERLASFAPGYRNLEDPALGLDAVPKTVAGAYDTFTVSAEALLAAVAAHGVLASFGWDNVYERARTLAALLATRLDEAGYTIAPRGPTTLVSWDMGEHNDEVPPRLAEQGIVIRHLPGTPLVRASVGAWNDESDLERLLAAL